MIEYFKLTPQQGKSIYSWLSSELNRLYQQVVAQLMAQIKRIDTQDVDITELENRTTILENVAVRKTANSFTIPVKDLDGTIRLMEIVADKTGALTIKLEEKEDGTL